MVVMESGVWPGSLMVLRWQIPSWRPSCPCFSSYLFPAPAPNKSQIHPFIHSFNRAVNVPCNGMWNLWLNYRFSSYTTQSPKSTTCHLTHHHITHISQSHTFHPSHNHITTVNHKCHPPHHRITPSNRNQPHTIYPITTSQPPFTTVNHTHHPTHLCSGCGHWVCAALWCGW